MSKRLVSHSQIVLGVTTLRYFFHSETQVNDPPGSELHKILADSMVMSFVVKGGKPPAALASCRVGTECSVVVSSLKGFCLTCVGELSSHSLPSLTAHLPPVEDFFFSRESKFWRFSAGLIYGLSPSCMAGDLEQFVKRAAAAGEAWVFAHRLLTLTGAPCCKAQEDGGRGVGFLSPGEFSISVFMSSNSPLQNRFTSNPSHSGVCKLHPTAACF